MTRLILLATLAAALTACASAPQPRDPNRPDCVRTDTKEPIDGGIGGTGKELPPCEE